MVAPVTKPLRDAVAATLGGDPSAPPLPTTVPERTRTKLWEIDQALICPVIGTCLTINDLAWAARKAGIKWDHLPSDFELHHLVVHQLDRPCRLARIIAKVLDKRYDQYVRSVGHEGRKQVLADTWERAVAAGEVPGTLWALVTNPATDDTLVQRLYQDVHMLSHLNGRAYRKELGRLHALEQEARGLSEMLHSRALRYRDKLAQKDRRIRALELEVANHRGRTAMPSEVHGLELQLGDARRILARTELRAKRAEARLGHHERRLDELTLEVTALRELLQEAREELALSERRLLALLGDRGDSTKEPSLLKGRRVAYVGGRPNLAPHLRALVESLDGRFVHHDGGIEGNRAELEEVVAGAELVFCPVDCVSHDACSRAKSCCRRTGSTFVPLRSASVSSFSAALDRLVIQLGEAASPAGPSQQSR